MITTGLFIGQVLVNTSNVGKCNIIIFNSSSWQIDDVQMDDNWKKMFELVGVTDVQNQTKETMDFIYDFVEKRGGIENVTREIEMESKGGPPLPTRDFGDYISYA